jgi:hypothetical protein
MNTIRYIGMRQFQVGVWISTDNGGVFRAAHDLRYYFQEYWKAAELCCYLNGGKMPESIPASWQGSY